MTLSRKVDMFGNEYFEGEDENGIVRMEARTDWFGNDYIQVEEREKYNTAEDDSGFGLALLAGILIFGVLAVAAPIAIWMAIFKEGFPALYVIAAASVAAGGYFTVRSRLPFKKSFRKALRIISLCFFTPCAVLSFVLPAVPEMYTGFSVGGLLSIAFISLLAAVGPAVLIGLICRIVSGKPSGSGQAAAQGAAAGAQHAGREWEEQW